MSSMVKVAREANVAVSTVSLTLNHRERVKPETRQRIEEAMQRLGYRPREKKNAPKPKSITLRIAFIYTLESLNPIEDPKMTSYCREVISGMQDYMAGSASFLSVFRGVDHVDHDLMVNEQINAKEFDGVILFGADSRNGYLERLMQSNLPMVVINRLPEHGRFSCVTLDYYGGAQLALEHLIGLGHRRIAAATQDTSGKWLVRENCDATRDTLKKHGIEPVIDIKTEDLGSPTYMKQLCKEVKEKGVTALFTGDYFAVSCVNALTDMGLRVPEDVSVVGFDDRGLTTKGGLSLTTIGYDKRRMGRMAIRMLQRLSQSRGKIKWLSSAVATHLVKGQTTAKVPDGAE